MKAREQFLLSLLWWQDLGPSVETTVQDEPKESEQRDRTTKCFQSKEDYTSAHSLS